MTSSNSSRLSANLTVRRTLLTRAMAGMGVVVKMGRMFTLGGSLQVSLAVMIEQHLLTHRQKCRELGTITEIEPMRKRATNNDLYAVLCRHVIIDLQSHTREARTLCHML